MRTDFDDVFPATKVDLSQLEWINKLRSETQFEIIFAYPMENPPQFNDFVYVCNGDTPIFAGYVLDVQDRSLTLTHARLTSPQ